GPSSMTMALAAAPYVVWMIATAEQCQAAALAAAGAADAFEAARAGVVPPPVIAQRTMPGSGAGCRGGGRCVRGGAGRRGAPAGDRPEPGPAGGAAQHQLHGL
ncbi:PPE domain-containing protein, partial [Mycobacterium nebraskense]|nr:PPE domain-containing protein [Mycobacterium nebraskense]